VFGILEQNMSRRLKPLVVALTAILSAPSAFAVDITGVHDLAIKNDPQLQAAMYRRDASNENRAQARSNLLPTLTASGSANRGSSQTSIAGVQVSDTDSDTESVRLTLNQSLYDPADYKRIEIARGQVSQGEAVYQQAYQDFLVRIADTYFNVLTAIDGVTFAEAEEKALQRQFEQAEQRFEVGLTAVTDVHEARASYDNARARAIVSRNSLADRKEGLRELTGQYFSELDPLQEILPLLNPVPASAEEWVEIALANNPAVQRAKHGVEIADGNAGLQRAGRLPSLSFSATRTEFTNNEFFGRDPFTQLPSPFAQTLENDDTTYGIQLNWQLYQGGGISSRTRQARAELNAAHQDLDAQQRATVRQTQNAFRAVVAGIQQVEAFGQALISAESALAATQAGFEVGTRTIVDVLIAEQRYFQAQRDNSTARHTYIVDHLRLKAAAGVLAEADLSTVNTILD
jgi:outer membrane protein